MKDKFTFVIPGKPEYLTMVRLALGSIADSAGFDVDAIEDIKTAVGDACKVICCHGKEKVAAAFTLECAVGEGELEIKLTDTSDHEIGKDQITMRCMNCPSEGDLNIFVMKSLMDEVELIENPNSKKSIKMIKRK